MKTYSLHELTDSRILYDKKPPRFMTFIILIVVALLIGSCILSNILIKTYIIRGKGLVTTEDKANVMVHASGEINDINIQEGKEVKEGDVLFTINPVESSLQLTQIDAQLDYDVKRIELLERAERDAINGVNSFDKNKPEEVEFYNRLERNYVKKNEYELDQEYLKKQGYTDDQKKTILGFSTEKAQLKIDKSKLEAQKDTYKKSTVIAPKSGMVHLLAPITRGMVFQSGNLLGSISNNNNDQLIVETLIPSRDRALISEDDEVSLVVEGLNEAEFGTIDGKVESIDNDSTIDTQTQNVYFKLRIKPKKTYLENKKGEKVNLILGMATEIRIKYAKITYMKYFLG